MSAVLTILIVRWQLWLTNYPRLGGGNLHIAHMLWGGLLMLVALGTVLSFVGRGVRMPAAIVGGIGFGLFIDEVGKFVTANNDYFFKPSAAIIYLVFVLLFLTTRAMRARRGLSPRENLVNAVELVAEGARRDLGDHERVRGLELLDHADPRNPLVAPLRRIFADMATSPSSPPSLAARLKQRITHAYGHLAERRYFRHAVGLLFGVWAVASLALIALLTLAVTLTLAGIPGVKVTGFERGFSLLTAASLASAVVAGLLVCLGVWKLAFRSRAEAYRQFEHALLLQIFIGQFFEFIDSQFAAVFGLAIDILLLVVVRTLLRIDERGSAGAGELAEAEQTH